MTLQFENVSLSYGNKKVLDNVSFSLKPGSITGLLGTNGAGKTTIFRLIMKFEKPDSGKISLFENSNYDNFVFKTIGFLPEKIPYHRKQTVQSFLYWLGLMSGHFEHKKPQLLESIEQWLKRTGLVEQKKQMMGSLSKGQLQKTALISAFLHDPSFVILDEPTSGIDPLFRFEIKQLLSDFKDSGKTLLISSHDLNELEKIVTDIIVLKEGKIAIQCSIDEIRKKNIDLDHYFYNLITQSAESIKSGPTL